MGWSLAVTIPVEYEWARRPLPSNGGSSEVAAIIFVFAVFGVSVLSYYLLRPVRELVAATEPHRRGKPEPGDTAAGPGMNWAI